MDITVRASEFGENVILGVRSQNLTNTSRSIMHVFVIDNSGSMGSYTRQLTDTICKGLVSFSSPNIVQVPGTLILFAEDAKVLTDSLSDSKQMDRLQYPKQGLTNITAGLDQGIECIIAKKQKKQITEDTHVILSLLTDGQHNNGPRPTSKLQDWRQKLTTHGITLSVNIISISSGSDVKESIQIKESLETVSMDMDSIFYANSHQEMASVLEKMKVAFASNLVGGKTVSLQLSGGQFTDTNLSTKEVFLTSNQEVAFIVKRGDKLEKIQIDGIEYPVITTDVSPGDVSLILDTLLPKLSRKVISEGVQSIQKDIDFLENAIDQIQTVLEAKSQGTDFDKLDMSTLTPAARRELLKKFRQKSQAFQEERNRLRQLKAQVGNNSSQQAEFLTGISRKYGAKAMLRSGTSDVSTAEIRKQMLDLAAKLKAALAEDEKLPDHGEKSYVTHQTPREQLSDWVESLETLAGSADPGSQGQDGLYDLLVEFSLQGIPIRINHNNAMQMDPFKTSCNAIDVDPVDSGSFLFTKQIGKRIQNLCREEVEDLLILIDPSCPNASKVAYWSPVNQYLTSITLCRDLYMYTGPKQMTSLHSHAFMRTLQTFQQNGSEAYLRLALRILYSIRAQFGKNCREGDNVELIRRWMDWKSITHLEGDNCQHPNQLMLLLSALDFGEIGVESTDATQPLLNLANEVLARNANIYLKYRVSDPGDAPLRSLSAKLLSAAFGINAENSPKPDPDVMKGEPPESEIRETIPRRDRMAVPQSGFDWLGGQTPAQHVDKLCGPYVFATLFGFHLQDYMKQNKVGWTDIAQWMEAGDSEDFGKLLASFKEFHKNSKDRSLNDVLKSPKWDVVVESMVAQAFHYSIPSDRKDITEKDVADSETLYELTSDLHMNFYQQANRRKREEWLAVIGDVTTVQAMSADYNTFSQLCGHHTHGLSREVFWGLAKAALKDNDKRAVFLQKSNPFVMRALDRLNNRK